MPILIPVGGGLDNTTAPVTHLFSVQASVIIGSDTPTGSLQAGVVVTPGSGEVIIFDVVSEQVQEARG